MSEAGELVRGYSLILNAEQDRSLPNRRGASDAMIALRQECAGREPASPRHTKAPLSAGGLEPPRVSHVPREAA